MGSKLVKLPYLIRPNIRTAREQRAHGVRRAPQWMGCRTGGSLTQKKRIGVRNGPFSGESVAFSRGSDFDVEVGDLDLSQVTAQTGPKPSEPGKTKVAKEFSTRKIRGHHVTRTCDANTSCLGCFTNPTACGLGGTPNSSSPCDQQPSTTFHPMMAFTWGTTPRAHFRWALCPISYIKPKSCTGSKAGSMATPRTYRPAFSPPSSAAAASAHSLMSVASAACCFTFPLRSRLQGCEV
mmetsp:Transcript_126308/g.218848  ORF Transcript_126308/g.218848 Transcript_126308/m.218848 type:complete len:237 (-) Transcript_126308:1057-1767(-)